MNHVKSLILGKTWIDTNCQIVTYLSHIDTIGMVYQWFLMQVLTHPSGWAQCRGCGLSVTQVSRLSYLVYDRCPVYSGVELGDSSGVALHYDTKTDGEQAADQYPLDDEAHEFTYDVEHISSSISARLVTIL